VEFLLTRPFHTSVCAKRAILLSFLYRLSRACPGVVDFQFKNPETEETAAFHSPA
jgi:hypothetical protein